MESATTTPDLDPTGGSNTSETTALKKALSAVLIVLSALLIAPVLALLGLLVVSFVLLSHGTKFTLKYVQLVIFFAGGLIKHLFFALAFVALVIWGTFRAMEIYTLHGEELTVPDFTNLNLNEVKVVAQQNEMRFTLIDSVYSYEHKKGVVIDQNPVSGFKVKRNRNIFLTINAHTAEMVEMPNIVGISIIQARADLETYGLNIGTLKYTQDLALNYVLEQQINGETVNPKTKVPKGSDVDLVLGDGHRTEYTKVPNLTGLTRSRAKYRLADAFLNIGNSTFDLTVETTKDTLESKVWKQRPQPFTDSLPLGTKIDVWFSKKDISDKIERMKKLEDKLKETETK